MGYTDKLTLMIVGEIISVRPSFPQSGTPQIEISGYDLSYLFTRVRKHRSWENKKDSEVVSSIIDEAKHNLSKARAKTNIEATKVVYPKIVQDGETDYKFIKKLADRNFFNFCVEGREFSFNKGMENEEPLTLEYRKSLLSFTPELNTANQVSEVIIRGWDPTSKRQIIGKASKKGKNGKSGGEIVENLYGKVEYKITDRPIYNQQEANTLADSILNKLSEGLIKGSADTLGIPEIRAGKKIILKGLGKKFSRDYNIERTTHNISSSGYSTTINVRGDVI